jgi:hypothetical protein
MSIPPTSIESERAFSAAAYIGNKLRNRLGNKTLDALLFLRSNFQNKQKIHFFVNYNNIFLLYKIIKIKLK